MRLTAWVTMTALAFISQALAQETSPDAAQRPAAAVKSGSGPPAAPKAKAPKKAAKAEPAAATPATPAQRDAYAALTAAERLAIQSDLIWSGDLSGSADPEFGDRAIAAVRTFQRRNKLNETGILMPEERQMLAAATRSKKDYNGWRLVEDSVTPGVRLGIPGKLVPQLELGNSGSRWSSARGEIQIETFREKMAGTTLAELFEEMKKKPATRRVENNSIQANSFVLSGLQGLKKFHVRVFLKDNEARGLTILFDQAMEGIMRPMVDTIANSYLPFGDAAGSSASRKVEYGSGIVVTQHGHVVTQRQLVENCQGLIVAGLGRADRVADDKVVDLALLRVSGAGHLSPLAFSTEPPKTAELTLIGIADPAMQAGARNVTTAAAKLRGVEGARVLLDASPARAFVGGAALDGQAQLAGMIDISPASGAGSSPAASRASFIPSATIRKFLDNAGVHPANGRSDLAAAKNAIVRVICVRK